MSEKKFNIIGLTDSRHQFLSPDVCSIIREGKVFSGGKRHHEIVAGMLPADVKWIDVKVPLSEVIKEYDDYNEIVVFASGDPLFYGYAVTLQREFPDSEIKVWPAFNSIQMLAHRLLLPYSSLVNVSLTGRSWDELDVALIEDRELIGVLTDKKKSPCDIAKRLLEYGYNNYRISVGERLGNEEESIYVLSLEEASIRQFKNPNCVILQQTSKRERFFGIPEQEFVHLEGRENMITKMPVRLLALSMLALYGKRSFWDIGFCTASVSIEAKLQFPRLHITAFERREESKRLFEDNTRKFGVPGIECVIGDFMDTDLTAYSRPDSVFIGGHGGRLEEIIKKISEVILPGGTIVFNSVKEETAFAFRKAVESVGMKVSESHLITLDKHNPITIMKAI